MDLPWKQQSWWLREPAPEPDGLGLNRHILFSLSVVLGESLQLSVPKVLICMP